MKSKIVISLLLFLPNVIQSQICNKADHRGQQVTSAMIQLKNKLYYLTKNFSPGGCCNDSVFLTCKDLNGTEILKKFIVTKPFIKRMGLVATTDSNIVLFAWSEMISCDTDGPKTFIYKVNSSGNFYWQIQTLRDINSLLPGANGGFEIFTGDSLVRFSASGACLGGFYHGIPSFGNAIKTSSSNYAISYAASGGARLCTRNQTGQQLLDVSTGALVGHLLESADGGILGIANGEARKYSATLGLLHNLSVSSFSTRVLASRNDSVFVAGYYLPNISPVYLLLDSAFTVMYTSSSNLESVLFTGICIDKNSHVNLISLTNDTGTGNFVGGTTSFLKHSGFFQTELTGNLDGMLDLGVSNISVLSTSISSAFGWSVAIVDAFVTVRNYCSDTVHSFKLNKMDLSGGHQYCLQGINKRFNYTILPYNSITFLTGTFVARVFPMTSIDMNYTLCLSTSVPGNQNDTDLRNDFYCVPALAVNTGISKNKNLQDIEVYPVPADDLIFVVSGKENFTFEIIDCAGMIISNGSRNKENCCIRTDELKSGLYFLKINSGENHYSKKIIIRH